MSHTEKEPVRIQRVEATEPLALYWNALRAAEATQRALAALYTSATENHMDELTLPAHRAWESAKTTAELIRQNIPQPENITPPLEI